MSSFLNDSMNPHLKPLGDEGAGSLGDLRSCESSAGLERGWKERTFLIEAKAGFVYSFLFGRSQRNISVKQPPIGCHIHTIDHY